MSTNGSPQDAKKITKHGQKLNAADEYMGRVFPNVNGGISIAVRQTVKSKKGGRDHSKVSIGWNKQITERSNSSDPPSVKHNFEPKFPNSS